MNMLQSHLFHSFVVAISYFIVKSFLRRTYKMEHITNKMIVQDSILVFVVSYLVCIFMSNINKMTEIKTHVFTTEPNF